MASAQDDIDTEKPLDPAVLRVQQRLQRMMLWSRGIMLVGFAVLFAVIFYKFYWVRPGVPAADALASDFAPSPITSLTMPSGGHITDSHIEGNRLTVTIDAPGHASVLIIDLETLRTLRRIDFTKTD